MNANQQQTRQQSAQYMVQQTISLRTNGKKLHNITRQVEAVLAQFRNKDGTM